MRTKGKKVELEEVVCLQQGLRKGWCSVRKQEGMVLVLSWVSPVHRVEVAAHELACPPFKWVFPSQ